MSNVRLRETGTGVGGGRSTSVTLVPTAASPHSGSTVSLGSWRTHGGGSRISAYDRGVSSFDDHFVGSTGGMRLNAPVNGMTQR